MIFDRTAVEEWSVAELDSEAVKRLEKSISLPRPLARFFVRRGFKDPSSVQKLGSECKSSPADPVDLVNRDRLAEELIQALRSDRTIQLGVFSNSSLFPAVIILKRGLEALGGEVKVSVSPSDLEEDNYSGIMVSASAPETLEPSRIEALDFVLIDSPLQSQKFDQNSLLVYPGAEEFPPAFIAYKVCELVGRKIYSAELPSFVAFDLETTGYSPQNSEIIEIGAVKYRQGKQVDTFETFVGSTARVPAKIQDLTGISSADLKDAPPPEKTFNKFADFIAGETLVAHNKGFDIPFLKYHFNKYLGRSLDNTGKDSMRVAQSSLPGLSGYDLATVAEYLGISLEDHHRALDDARAAGEIFTSLKSETPRQLKQLLEPQLPLVALDIALAENNIKSVLRDLFGRGHEVLENSSEFIPALLRELSPPRGVVHNGFSGDLFLLLESASDNFVELVNCLTGTGRDDVGRLAESIIKLGEPSPESHFFYQEKRAKMFAGISPELDAQIKLSDLTEEFMENIKQLPPYSLEFPPPVFKIEEAQVINIRATGKALEPGFVVTVRQGKQWATVVLATNSKPDFVEIGARINLLCEPALATVTPEQPVLNCLSLCRVG